MIKKSSFLIIWMMMTAYIGASDYQLISQTLGVSAEHISLGSGMFVKGSNSIFSNDAYIANYKTTVDIFATQLMTDHNIIVGSLSYVLPTKTRVSVGTSLSLNSGFEVTEQTGIDDEHTPTGTTYDMSKYHYKVSATQTLLSQFHVGVGLNMISQKSPSKGTGYSMDLGLKYYINKTGLIGIAVRNVLSKDVSYANGTENLPRTIELGLFQPIYKKVVISPSITAIQSEQNYEVNYLYALPIIIEPLEKMKVMGSISQKYAGLNAKTYFNVGTQLDLGGLCVSYAYRKSDYREASNQHFVSIQINI